nr:phospholipase-like protein [Tanacetum cinerariifolium]
MLDEDAVRLCLLIASELVFMGKEKRNFLTKHIMWLVDDFDAWNDFPWGEYMWEKFYNRTVNVIWILESYPNSKKWWSKKANVIPRGLAWSKVTMFEKSGYEELFRLAWFKASAEFLKRLDDQYGTFFQNDQVDDGDGVLDSQSDDEDGVLDSQTKDVIEEATMLPTMSSNSPQAGNVAVSEFFAEFDALKKEVFVSIEEKPNFSSHHNDSSNHIGGVFSEAKASSSSAHLRNDEDVSHLDDNMGIDGQNAKDGYSNYQHHLHLLIKALGTKIENPSIDAVVPPKVDDPMLRTIKPKDDFDEADVDSYDVYMLLFNDEEQPAKSSLNDLESQQEPDKVDVKDRILEQQPNADKGKTIVIQETVGVTVKEGPSLGRGWLTDQHLDLSIDLMWSLRPPEVDWAIVSPHFLTCILSGMMADYFSNGHMYPLPWIAVEKVYFLVNEPKEHWYVAELEIHTGVVIL